MPTVTFTLASLPSSTAKRLRFEPRDAPWVNTSGAVVTPDGFEAAYPRGAAQSITLDTGPWRVRIGLSWYAFDVPAGGGNLATLIAWGIPSTTPQATITAAVEAFGTAWLANFTDSTLAAKVTGAGPVKSALDANYAPLWQANTAYPSGARAMAPTGEVVVRTSAGTSRPTYDTAEQVLWRSPYGRVEVPDALRGLSQQRTRRNPLSRVFVPPRGSYTIFSDTSGVPGCVTSIWMTMSPVTEVNHTHLQVFVDGETTPSVDVDLGTLWLSHLAAANGTMWSTANIKGEAGSNTSTGGTLNFPIPYGSSCEIKLVNPSPTSLYTFTQVDWRSGVVVPFRLRSFCRPYALAKTLGISDVATLFTTPAGSAGWLAWLGYVGQGATAQTYLERNMEITFDGESSPSLGATGGEDFFLGSFYFQGKTTYSQPSVALSYQNQATFQTLVGLDLLKGWGGIRFDSQMKLDMTTKSQVTTAHSYGFCALVYTPLGTPWSAPLSGVWVPQAPWISSITASDATLTVNLRQSANAGGAAIAKMTVTAIPTTGGTVTQDVAATATQAVLTGLTNGTAYTVTVTATNSAGASEASPAMVSTPAQVPVITDDPAGGTGRPDSVTGMAAWWKVNSLTANQANDVLASWPDSGPSGKAFAASAAQRPTIVQVIGQWGGKPRLRFNGVDNVMKLASALATTSGTYTVFIIAGIRSGYADGVNGVRLFNADTVNGSDTLKTIFSTNPSGKFIANAGSADVGATVTAVNDGSPFLYSAITGSGGNVWVNGVAGTSGNAGTNPPGIMQIGQRPGTLYYPVDIAEIIVYTGALSSTDRHNIEAWLAAKYGLAAPAVQ